MFYFSVAYQLRYGCHACHDDYTEPCRRKELGKFKASTLDLRLGVKRRQEVVRGRGDPSLRD
uniref:Uncharacterized protein n=1 Tax=Arundo donax TaxID=35708 RepID=A0A0A8ZD12_ARUDO